MTAEGLESLKLWWQQNLLWVIYYEDKDNCFSSVVQMVTKSSIFTGEVVVPGQIKFYTLPQTSQNSDKVEK